MIICYDALVSEQDELVINVNFCYIMTILFREISGVWIRPKDLDIFYDNHTTLINLNTSNIFSPSFAQSLEIL